MEKKIFKLKKSHLKLLKNAYISWQDCEYGAPEINPKRPYGNSYAEGDVAKILGWKYKGELSEKQEAKSRKLHEETEIALQIVLINIGKEVRLGNYANYGYGNKWIFEGDDE